MPTIKDKSLFKPSDIRKTWLGTRKKQIEGTKHPGFYQTTDFNIDKRWVYFVAAIELAAIIVTIYGGIVRGGMFLIGAIIAVILFIAFDIVGSNLHHKPISEKQESKCKLALLNELDESMRPQRLSILTDLNIKSSIKSWGIFLIIFSAVLKLVALFLLGTLGFVYIGIMTVLYMIAIYIHINHTGFYLAEKNTEREIKKQHSLWLEYNRLKRIGDGTNEAKSENHKGKNYDIKAPQKGGFISQYKLWNHKDDVPFELKIEDHKLLFDRKEDNFYHYEFITRGIFTDDDVKAFLSIGHEINREEIAIHCLYHQMKHNS
ncbi:hypothetical protein [uncultured Lutibacter sp.]|uniref:hypothetical protein n=1 Tax=uncultured Lutibacter sp. TaxID=437739 RepID=UPI0026018750|nr:hypothetical protein [uncultured Lutibacter sp.]